MNYEEIKKIIDDMGNSKIDFLDIEFPDGVKISMKKTSTTKVVENMNEGPITSIQINDNRNEKEEKTCIEDNYNIVKSPMVGTFYASPSPKEEPFVKKRDRVKKGDTLCVIEAMKLMNEIESEFDGEIVEILVNNEDMVEYGMPLFKIK